MTDRARRHHRFDVVVWVVLVSLAGAVLTLIWRGDRVGVQVVGLIPDAGAVHVSTKADIIASFSEDISETTGVFRLTPAITGTVDIQGAHLGFRPQVPLLPGTIYTAHVSADVRSVTGRPLLQPIVWSFKTAGQRVLYVSGVEDEYLQLFAVPLAGGSPVQITDEPFGIWDFSLSPDGTRVAYAASEHNDVNDLWIVDADGRGHRKLLDCGDDMDCTSPVWVPDGKRIVFERRSAAMGDSVLVPSRLWWLDPESGETVPVFRDQDRLGHSASVSAEGRWLSYISPLEEGLQLYEIETGIDSAIEGEMQGEAAWSPVGQVLVIATTRFMGTGYGAALLKADMETGSYVDLSEGTTASDSSPVWSPDGRWIAFRRGTPAAPGGELWIMRSDGSESRPLTHDPRFGSASPSWSPDGRSIIYQRFSLEEPYAEPEVWVLNMEDHETRRIAAPGAWPVWLP